MSKNNNSFIRYKVLDRCFRDNIHRYFIEDLISECEKEFKSSGIGGGGQPHYATAGGKNTDGLSAAIDKVIELANI